MSPRASLFRQRSPKSARRGSMTLRAAINQANANPGADEIEFAVAGTIPLAKALPAAYQGPITAQGGMGHVMVMPDQSGETTDGSPAYSADNLGDGQLRIVGTYSNASAITAFDFIFAGTVADVSNPATYSAMPSPLPSATPGTVWNIAHSTSGGLVVGNVDESGPDGNPLGGGRVYVSDVATDASRELLDAGSAANNDYGIGWNGGTSYAIAGGWSNSPVNDILNPGVPLSQAPLVDYDSASGLFSNWKSFSYVHPAGGTSVGSPIDGYATGGNDPI